MIRFAEKKDIPEILEIYAPYVLTTTNSFEYRVPTLEEFTLRFEKITRQFPWLVWEVDGRVLGYAYASLPGQPISGAVRCPFIFLRSSRERA